MTNDIRTLAKWHRIHVATIFLVLLNIAATGLYEAWTGGVDAEPGMTILYGLSVATVAVLFVLTIILAYHVYTTTGFVLTIVAMFVPPLNLIMILVVGSSANYRLKKLGAKVGIFGAKLNSSPPPLT